MAKKSHKKEETPQVSSSLEVVPEESDDALIDMDEILFLEPDAEEVNLFTSSGEQDLSEEEADVEQGAPVESTVPSHEELQKLREQLEQTRLTSDGFRDQLLRKAADLENSRNSSVA